MNRITRLLIACCSWVLVAASTCVAQMYTVTDLGTLGGTTSSATAINNSGQVVGNSFISGDTGIYAFRTAPSSPINPATDDLGDGVAVAINDFGQVVFDGVGNGINDSGQMVGTMPSGDSYHGFHTAPNSPINPATDDLGNFGPYWPFTSQAFGINASGQVVGWSVTNAKNCYVPTGDGNWWTWHEYVSHAFRTAPNSPINSATDDLGTLGCYSKAVPSTTPARLSVSPKHRSIICMTPIGANYSASSPLTTPSARLPTVPLIRPPMTSAR